MGVSKNRIDFPQKDSDDPTVSMVVGRIIIAGGRRSVERNLRLAGICLLCRGKSASGRSSFAPPEHAFSDFGIGNLLNPGVDFSPRKFL
jgi:hypothetical protein